MILLMPRSTSVFSLVPSNAAGYCMAPTPMMAPWPACRRGTEWLVGADAARVGQRDRGAGEVVRGQLVVAGLLDDLFVRLPELQERHVLAALDRGHDERAGVVLALHVDREPEVDVLRRDRERLPVDQLVVPDQVREVLLCFFF